MRKTNAQMYRSDGAIPEHIISQDTGTISCYNDPTHPDDLNLQPPVHL